MTYQQVIIVGNVGRDPELRYTPQGIAVTDFSLAVTDRWTSQDGQKQERTTWWKVTCWRRQAEIVAEYVKKGRQVLVIASRVEASAYTGRDGAARASLDVTADSVKFLSGSGNTPSGGGGDYDDFSPPPDEVGDIPF